MIKLKWAPFLCDWHLNDSSNFTIGVYSSFPCPAMWNSQPLWVSLIESQRTWQKHLNLKPSGEGAATKCHKKRTSHLFRVKKFQHLVVFSGFCSILQKGAFAEGFVQQQDQEKALPFLPTFACYPLHYASKWAVQHRTTGKHQLFSTKNKTLGVASFGWSSPLSFNLKAKRFNLKPKWFQVMDLVACNAPIWNKFSPSGTTALPQERHLFPALL